MKNSSFLTCLVAVLFLAATTAGKSQSLFASAPQRIENESIRNQAASFPNLNGYLDKNLKYPEVAQKNGVEGTVTVLAQIGETGEIQSLSLHQGIGFGCDETVMELVSNMPLWQPAIKNGLHVPQKVFIRVRFKLQ